MKKIQLIILIIMICVLCGGCQKSETARSNKVINFECPSEINKELTDYISVNAKVIIPESAKDGTVQALQAKQHDFTSQKEEIQQLIGNNKEVEVDNGFLACISDYGTHVSSTIRMDPQYADYNGNLYLTDKNLAFMSQTDAFNNVKSALNQLGIEINENYICYVMDYRIMKEQEDVTNAFGEENEENKKEEWTEDDSLYYFRMKRTFNEIQVITDEVSNQDNSPYESMEVMYGKDGIRDIFLGDYYDITEDGREVDLITVEEAIEKIKEKYDAVISENKISITNIELCMKIENEEIDGNKAIIVPAWKFGITTDEKGTEIEPYSGTVLINAETGKEIL